MSKLGSRLRRVEKALAEVAAEPLVVKITSFADPPSPEEEAVLAAEVRRRIQAGETLVICLWSGREARKLGAPERAAQAADGKLGVTIACPDGQRLRL